MSMDIEDSNVEETGKAFTSNYKFRSQFVLVCNSSANETLSQSLGNHVKRSKQDRTRHCTHQGVEVNIHEVREDAPSNKP